MIQSLFEGEKVRLTGLDLEKDIEILARWTQDSEYLSMYEFEPARPLTTVQVKKKLQADEKPENRHFRFGVRACDDNRLLGTVFINWIEYTNGYAWLLLNIGDPQERGKGFGADALRLALGFVFNELNLHRINCTIFEYNLTARRLLESQGFIPEIRFRQAIHRKGKRFDALLMGLLRTDWERRQTDRQGVK